jgi:hypothetical protein
VEKMLAASKKYFVALTGEELQTVIQEFFAELGFDHNRRKLVANLFDLQTPYDLLENESFEIEREKWELTARVYLLK